MAIFDFLRELVSKKQSTPEKWLESSVRVVTAGQHGAQKPSFNHQRAVDACRSWVFAAANINAQAVASVPIRLYAKKGNGRKLYKTRSVPRHQKQYLLGDGHGDARPSNGVLRKIADFGEDMEEVTESHPIIELLSSTNPFLNGFDMTVLRILYGELTGNAYLHPVIDEDSGLPAELWPLAPQFTEVIPDEDEFISGYLYGISADRKQVFERDEVIHFRRPNPGNLYYGLGKIEAAYGAVLSNQAVHDMDLAMFQNSARPDYAVVVRGTPTSDQLDRFQEQVEQRLRGTRRDGNFIAVTGDVQFTPLNFPPKDVAGREDIVEEIAAVFGVPVSMLKANDPNLASARTGFAQWREGTVLPLLRMDEEELNQTLLPMFGLEDELCLAYDNPVPRDTQYELQERQTAVQGGWRTINEARLEEGREPFEDNEFADQPLINGQPLGASAQQPPGPGGGMPGMDLSSLFSDDGQPEEEGDSPDAEAAAKFLKSVRDGTLQGYSAIKLLQGCGFSRQVAEKMVDAESKANNIERTEDDLYDTKEQAAAVASLIGCRGVRSIDADGETKYCPCADEKDFNTLTGKCPEGECDGDHGGQPRPKAFRLRHILDGAATQELTKSFGDWSVRFKATSDNCGTGAGGFQQDNTCASGDGAGSSQASADVGARDSKEEARGVINRVEKRREQQSPEDRQAEKDAAEAVSSTVISELDALDYIDTSKLDRVVSGVVKHHDISELDRALANRGVLTPQGVVESYGVGLEGFVKMSNELGTSIGRENPEVLSVDQMTDSQKQSAARLLAGAQIAHERYLPEYAVNHAVMFHSGDDMLKEGRGDLGTANAFVTHATRGRTISMNVDNAHTFDNARLGQHVGADAASLYVHEVGHVLHSNRVRGYFKTDRSRFDRINKATKEFKSNEAFSLIDRGVSTYATKNAFEFVAETFTMKQTRPKRFQSLPKKLRDLYEELGGP